MRARRGTHRFEEHHDVAEVLRRFTRTLEDRYLAADGNCAPRLRPSDRCTDDRKRGHTRDHRGDSSHCTAHPHPLPFLR
jgi:hypothetical protein